MINHVSVLFLCHCIIVHVTIAVRDASSAEDSARVPFFCCRDKKLEMSKQSSKFVRAATLSDKGESTAMC
jgi:hypothetical protein